MMTPTAKYQSKRDYYNQKMAELRQRILVKANTKVLPKPSKKELKTLIQESNNTKDVSYYESKSSFKTFSKNWI